MNVGPCGRLRAVGVQCGLIGSKCGFSPLVFARIVGSKPLLFASPSDLVCGPLQLAIAQILVWPYSSVILDIKGELHEATAEYLRKRGHKIRVVDPRGVGHQYDPLRGKSTERELYAVAKYLLDTESERDPIFIQRGMRMLTQLFLAGREENRQAGFEKYRLLPYAGQLMNLPINQVAAHV